MNNIKHIGIACIFAVFVNSVVAQPCEQYQTVYPFLQCEKNNIQYFGRSSETFDFFYEKLLKLQLHGTDRLNILHFGDSHIQADHLPDRMRYLLRGENTNWTDGDRGLIFPFTIAKSNNPHSYIVDYSGEWSSIRNSLSTGNSDLGLTGMSISTSDSRAMLKISQPQTGYTTSPFTRIRVFHSIGRNVPEIVLKESDNLLHQITNEAFGYTLFLLKESMDSLSFVFNFDKHKLQEISIYGISLETGNAGSTYSALGVNGANVKALLKSNLLEKQLTVMNPSLIILSYGINDVYQNFSASEFESDYNTLIQRIRFALPNVPILLTTPGDAMKDRTQTIKEFSKLIDIIYEVAKNNDCAVWNFYDVMGGKGSINQWFQAGLTNTDKLHFIKKGYELQADLLFQALIQNYLDTIK
ncbi:MAG: GDSL-type esterase/lipase family protein [Bacteroidales bacterium]|jgi:lysophospholipase L1-like esterase|nr:GDSL-type esterase/lipase family protein [Bacteroidales bacterium]